MSNVSRHLIGVLLGVAAVPVVGFGVVWAPAWPSVAGYAVTDVPRVADRAAELAALGVIALVIGLLAGSRLSPLASLLPGLALTALGVLGALGTPLALAAALEPPGGGDPWFARDPALLLVGGLLLVASLPVARWRARRDRRSAYDDDRHDDGYGPGADDGRYGPAEGTPIRDWGDDTAVTRPVPGISDDERPRARHRRAPEWPPGGTS
ncbi:hypothetical protein [Nocardiopsis trehalosi]|jgi:hypothetical protein|uniref:hypothetical protein n=1 Tax=Nocardiopsis trehalosi TaxID=109329 RepID=UPI000830F67A|nr:hypothetical protein [Nocardiopsis trehalosi]